jgi:H+/Cl- antiporter ClcA
MAVGKRTATALGVFGGAVAGAVAAKKDWLNTLSKKFVQILDRHGLAVALVSVLVPAALFLVYFLLRQLINAMQGEINRLAEERDKLLGSVLKAVPNSGSGTRQPKKRA